MMRFVALLALAALALAGCDAQPEGKPVARAKIDGSVGAPAPTPSEDATIASQVESACRSVIFENTSLQVSIQFSTIAWRIAGNSRQISVYALYPFSLHSTCRKRAITV